LPIREASILAALSALAFLALAGDARAAAPVAGTALDSDRAREYWTPRRLAAARPLPAPAPPRAWRGRAAEGGGGQPAGVPGFLPPSPPRLGVGVAARRGSGEVRAQRRFPQRANGKLFFTQGRKRYMCSAVVVQSRSDAVILTAGHCVFYRGRWSRRVLFVPAYRRGSRPFGLFRGAAAAVPRPWWLAHNPNYDYGAIKLRRGSRGSRVGDVTGEIGVSWNYPRDQLYRIVGYPVNFGGGERMWGCSSRFRRRDGGRFGGPASLGVTCRMRRGSSGGGWTYERSPSNGPYVASVTSHYYPRDPGLLFGPYFDREVLTLIRYANRR
jgi:V8-like Glu-specific endopeptidase